MVEEVSSDSLYLSMSDDDLELLITIVLSRDYPFLNVQDITGEELFPVILLSKKELFYTLAIKYANQYDIGADSNNYLKRSQRFDHYMSLANNMDKELEEYYENGGGGGYGGHNTLNSFNVTLSNRFYTKYNHQYGTPPKIHTFRLNNITKNSVELFWRCSMNDFKRYSVFISDEPIVDLHNVTDIISKKAKQVVVIADFHQSMVRIENLTAESDYFVAVVAEDRASLKDYASKVFTTLGEEPPIVVEP